MSAKKRPIPNAQQPSSSSATNRNTNTDGNSSTEDGKHDDDNDEMHTDDNRHISGSGGSDSTAKRQRSEKHESLKDAMQCTVCYYTYRLPYVLGCGHSFCNCCLLQHKTDKCPLCNYPQGKVDPIPNWALLGLINAIQGSSHSFPSDRTNPRPKFQSVPFGLELMAADVKSTMNKTLRGKEGRVACTKETWAMLLRTDAKWCSGFTNVALNVDVISYQRV